MVQSLFQERDWNAQMDILALLSYLIGLAVVAVIIVSLCTLVHVYVFVLAGL